MDPKAIVRALTSCMRRSVSSLVIAVNRYVQPEVLCQVVVVPVSQHVRVVPDKVQVLLDPGQLRAGPVHVAVYARGERREAGNEVDAVLEGVCPVLALLGPLLVRCLEGAVVVEGGHADAQLGHGVE